MIGDVSYALRSLSRERAFSAVVIASLALAIGASTSLFTVVNGFLLRPMPVAEPDRLVALYSLTKDREYPGDFSWLDLEELRKETRVFAAVFGHNERSVRIAIGNEPELGMAESVTGNYFSGLRASPAVGRFFDIANDRAVNQTPEVVLTYGYWQRRFKGDPSVVGRKIRVNDVPVTIVGVGPRGLSGTRLLSFLPDLWVPVSMQSIAYPSDPDLLERRRSQWISVRARLQPGVSIKQARAALEAMARRWNDAWPDAHRTTRVGAAPAPGKFHAFFHVRGLVGSIKLVLGGIVCITLLLACANVANLMLARGSARAKEFAVRASLGAGRGRLMRSLFAESLLLSIGGGVAGLLLALWLNSLLFRLMPPVEFTAFDPGEMLWVDRRVLLFSAGVSLITAVLFGTYPAWKTASTTQPMDALRTARGDAPGPLRARTILVGAQVALCFVLLTAAGLFVRSLRASQKLDVGFQTEHLLLASYDLNPHGYNQAAGLAFGRTLVEKLRAQPGIRSAAIAFPLPLDAYTSGTNIIVDGAEVKPGERAPFAFHAVAGPGYFETVDTPILRGRPLDLSDAANAPHAAVINRAMADRFWPGQDALGRTFRLSGDPSRPIYVVGIARNGKYLSLGEGDTPFFWLSHAQRYAGRMRVLVKTDGPPMAAAAALRAAFRSVDPTVPLYGLDTGGRFLLRPLAASSIIAAVASLFGLIALTLASVGLFGTMQYVVSRRTREMGIRAALGATRMNIGRLVATSGLRMLAAGAAVGLCGALAGTRLLSSFLVGVAERDPLTFATVMLVELAAAMAASALPAWRAARTDPAIALRSD